MSAAVNVWAKEWLGLIVLATAVLTPVAAFVGVDVIGPGIKIDRVLVEHKGIQERIDSTNNALISEQNDILTRIVSFSSDYHDLLTIRCVETPPSTLRSRALFRLAARCESLLANGGVP